MQLFKVEKSNIKTVSFTEFVRAFTTYNAFKEFGTILGDTCYEEVFNLNFENKEYGLFYHLSTKFNTVCNYKSFRCLKIQFGNDFVIIRYRYIKIFKTTQIRIFGLPKSINNIKENEFKVLSYLDSLSFVKFVVNIKDTTKFSDCELIYYYRDYFYDFNVFVPSGIWMRKHAVNQFNNDKDFTSNFYFGELSPNILTKIEELYDIWADSMPYYTTSTHRKQTLKLFRSLDRDVYKCLIWYKNKIIYADVGIIDRKLGHCMSVAILHLGRLYSQRIFRNLTLIGKYILRHNLLKLGIDRCYIAGAEKNSSLDIHKQNTSEGYIDYFLCKGVFLNEFV